MPDLGDDPGQANIDGIRDVAAVFRARAQDARDDADHVQSASNVLTSAVAVSVDAVRPGIVTLYGKYTVLGEADDQVAIILEEYATALEDLRFRAAAVRAECASDWSRLWEARAAALGPMQERLVGGDLNWDEVTAYGLSRDPASGGFVEIDTQAWVAAIDEFTTSRDAYRLLGLERECLDAQIAARLKRVELFAALSDDWTLGARGTGVMVDSWAGSTTGITAEALTTVEDPALVRTIWETLTKEQQLAMIASAPMLLGGLAGLPPWARVAANKHNAAARVREIDRVLAAEPHPYRPKTADELTKLRAERSYLALAADGTVQLYYYDHTTDSIIEMIGEITPNTTEINTYVPGTFTSAFSFYNSEAQQVGDWMSRYDESVVTFVWKVGEFPGETPATGGVHLFPDILEANDESFTLGKGEQIADFQTELRAAVGETSADFNGIGHSWGLAAVASAEEAHAQFDSVVSLAGAGMPEGWEPQRGTDYSHFSYVDALSMAQESGMVWDGRNPGNDSAFDSRVYASEGEFDMPLAPGFDPYTGMPSATPAPTIPVSTAALDNHNRIATGREDNVEALVDMVERIRR